MQRPSLLLAILILTLVCFACESSNTSLITAPDGDSFPSDQDETGDLDQESTTPPDGDSLPDGDMIEGDVHIDGDSSPDGDMLIDGDLPIDGDIPGDGDSLSDGDIIPDGDWTSDGDILPDGDWVADGDDELEIEQDLTDGDIPENTEQESDSDIFLLTDPGMTGTSEWSTGSYDLELSGGLFGTTIPLYLYVPDENGPLPVIVFTHGFQLTPSHYTQYAEHLASWGFIVVMPQMPGSLVAPKTHRELKEYLQAILDWIEQDNMSPTGKLAGKADLTRIGLSGHSMGGKISLLTSAEDPRPAASFVIDPVDAAGSPFASNPVDYPSVTPELMPQISIPLGLLGETLNGTCTGFGCQPCAPAEDNFQQYYQYAVSPAIEIEVLGASHMSFLDNPNCGFVCSVCPAGTDNTDTTHYLTRKYMTAFYLVELRQQQAYSVYLTGDYMAIDETAQLVASQTKNGF